LATRALLPFFPYPPSFVHDLPHPPAFSDPEVSPKRRRASSNVPAQDDSGRAGNSSTDISCDCGKVSRDFKLFTLCAVSDDFSTTSKTTQFPFLRLPGELRNKIYALAVGGHVICVRSRSLIVRTRDLRELFFHLDNLSGPSKRTDSNEVITVTSIFKLALVCRQFYTEAALFQFKYNIIHFHPPVAVRVFLEEFPRHKLDAITEIAFHSEITLRTAIQLGDTIFVSKLPALRRIFVRRGSYLDNKLRDPKYWASLIRLRMDTHSRELEISMVDGSLLNLKDIPEINYDTARI
jgi:hypothetical protein